MRRLWNDDHRVRGIPKQISYLAFVGLWEGLSMTWRPGLPTMRELTVTPHHIYRATSGSNRGARGEDCTHMSLQHGVDHESGRWKVQKIGCGITCPGMHPGTSPAC